MLNERPTARISEDWMVSVQATFGIDSAIKASIKTQGVDLSRPMTSWYDPATREYCYRNVAAMPDNPWKADRSIVVKTTDTFIAAVVIWAALAILLLAEIFFDVDWRWPMVTGIAFIVFQVWMLREYKISKGIGD